MTYIPKGPFMLKDGEKKGLCLERVLFEDPKWIIEQSKKFKSQNAMDGLCRHIEWLMERGEKIVPTMLCPQCGIRTVTHFSVLGTEKWGYSMSHVYTCCGDATCIERLKSQGIEKEPALYSLRFSAMKSFSHEIDLRQIATVMHNCLELQSDADDQVLFEVFAKK